MTKEKEDAIKAFRKLNSFLQLNAPVHFKLKDGHFRNGTIIDLSLNELTLVLKEDMMGNIPILLEEIDERSICEKRSKEEGANGKRLN